MNEINVIVQNLFRTLQNDPKTIFYTINKLSKTISNKAKKATYDKDKVFANLYKHSWKTKFFLKKMKINHLLHHL